MSARMPEVSPNDRLNWAIDRAILSHVRESSSLEEPVQERLISPKYHDLTSQTPTDWRDGITAARLASGIAHQTMLNYARKARGEGVSWEDLAESLGVKADADQYGKRAAEKAFELVAGYDERSYMSPTVNWDCSSCGAWIKDHGPYNGHPSDDEEGHAESCERQRRALVAFRNKWGD